MWTVDRRKDITKLTSTFHYLCERALNCQESQTSGRELNPGPSEYEACDATRHLMSL